MSKSKLGEKGLMSFCFQVTGYHQGKAGLELKAGTEADAMEECCLLAFLIVCSVGLITQDHQPKGGTTHSGLGTPILIIN